MISRFRTPAALAAFLCLSPAACRLETSDPAAQATAILHKHPSDFLDQLISLDALAAREAEALESRAAAPNGGIPGRAGPRSILAESLYAYTRRLRPSMETKSAPERIELLNAFLFDSLGITPILDGAPLSASVPSLVLSRRQGSCVGLALLYLALGPSLGLPLTPVYLPGHVFIRYRPETGGFRNVETLRGGIARSDSFYREAFSLGKRPWYSMQDRPPGTALAALIFNLGNAHRGDGDLESALAEYRLVEEALPGFPEALGNQGVCLMQKGERVAAEERFAAALAGDSLAEPALRNLDILHPPAPAP